MLSDLSERVALAPESVCASLQVHRGSCVMVAVMAPIPSLFPAPVAP